MKDQAALLSMSKSIVSIATLRMDRPRRIDRVIDYFGDRRVHTDVTIGLRLDVHDAVGGSR